MPFNFCLSYGRCFCKALSLFIFWLYFLILVVISMWGFGKDLYCVEFMSYWTRTVWKFQYHLIFTWHFNYHQRLSINDCRRHITRNSTKSFADSSFDNNIKLESTTPSSKFLISKILFCPHSTCTVQYINSLAWDWFRFRTLTARNAATYTSGYVQSELVLFTLKLDVYADFYLL